MGAKQSTDSDKNAADNAAATSAMVTEIPLASKYGSTLAGGIRQKDSASRVRKTKASQTAFMLAVFLPFLVYAVACTAIAIVYFFRPDAAMGLIVAAALIPLWFAMKASKEIKASTAAEREALIEEQHHGNVLGLKTFMALLFGTSVGYFLYTEYFFVYEATMSAQSYTNISPNMPGGGLLSLMLDS
jgi:hypothetical protein